MYGTYVLIALPPRERDVEQGKSARDQINTEVLCKSQSVIVLPKTLSHLLRE